MMKIEQLYDKDIARRINPAVVVSEMDEYFIKQEIDEYVFTPTITKNVYKFLDAITNKKEGKTGVWISGYYGSGKSHFIKYLYYCLHKKYGEKAFANFKESVKDIDPLDEPNIGLVTTLQNKFSNLQIDEIIFNIDAVSDKDHAKERITRVLLNELNKFRGYNNTNIALALYLEKQLDKKGLFQDFKQKIEATFNEKWDNNQIRFARVSLDKVLDIAVEFDSDIDKESMKSTILDKKQDYTIEFLINELKDYLSDKPEHHKLIFFIDEVSQYIGSDTTLLLNLQTIVEEIGSKIGPRVWVVCTAQQELSNLIDSTDDRTEDFGKIFGRFETMISLESQDAAYITKKRVLDKNSEGIGLLNDYYQDNKGAIENQFVFEHDLYRNYNNKKDFTLTYPFIPYQFRLISDVFESFSNVGYVGEGVKNTERSILGITHYTANLCKEEQVGFYVPFDMFFNEQFEKHLTHHARNILDRAYNISEIQDDLFGRRLVNGLFMISNLGESKSVNFPANIENLSLLLMEKVDTPKVEIQEEAQKVLNVLVRKNIIQESEGKYRFLKEDEIEVAQLIKNTAVTTDDRLTYIYDDIISKVIKPETVVSFGNRNFRIAVQVDEKQIGQKGDFTLKFSIYDSSDIIHIAHSTPENDLVVGISEWLRNDSDTKEKFLQYARTKKFTGLHSRSATGTRMETLNNFSDANKILLRDIQKHFENMFLQTSFISKNQVITPGELNTSAASSRMQQMITRHMEEVFRKHKLSLDYATSNKALIENARSKQSKLHKELSAAEEEVNNRLNMEGESPVVGDIVRIFEVVPYGWKDIATLDVLLNVAKKGYRRFEWRGEEISMEVFAEKAINSKERFAITIHKEKTHSKEDVQKFIHTVNDEIFAETLIASHMTDFKEAVETFRSKLEDKITNINKLKDEYESRVFSLQLKNYYNTLNNIYQTRNNDEVMSQVFDKKQQIKEYRDKFKMLEEFIDNNIIDYEQIAGFVSQNKNNFDSLDDAQQVRANELIEYFNTDDEPWDRFPQMKKAYKELYQAIKEHIKQLKDEVISTYENIFEEIENHRKALGVEERNLTTDSSSYLKKIKKEKQIAQLEIYKLKAADFRAMNFKYLEDHKAEKEAEASGKAYVTSFNVSVAKEMPPTTIDTPEQLEKYIDKLREQLMAKLKKNQKLFIN